MLNTLTQYDEKTSSGILARTALFLNNNLSTSILNNISDEQEIRKSLLQEISNSLSIENNETNKDQILDYIDNELEKTNHVNNPDKVIARLSDKAILPSDLFQISVVPNVSKFYQTKFSEEYSIIEQTVKVPDAEYHFNNDGLTRPSNISLFLKRYKGKHPYNDFNLLVVGQRKGIQFIVHQVWRMYDDLIRDNKETDLIEVLKNFADRFGVEVTFRNQKAKFFLSEIAKSEKEFKINVDNDKLVKDKKGKTEITFAHFTEEISNSNQKLSLFLVIDLNKYRNYLQQHNSFKR